MPSRESVLLAGVKGALMGGKMPAPKNQDPHIMDIGWSCDWSGVSKAADVKVLLF